jgi:hypothetical protein
MPNIGGIPRMTMMTPLVALVQPKGTVAKAALAVVAVAAAEAQTQLVGAVAVAAVAAVVVAVVASSNTAPVLPRRSFTTTSPPSNVPTSQVAKNFLRPLAPVMIRLLNPALDRLRNQVRVTMILNSDLSLVSQKACYLLEWQHRPASGRWPSSKSCASFTMLIFKHCRLRHSSGSTMPIR